MAVLIVIGLGAALIAAGAWIHAVRGRRTLPVPSKESLRKTTTRAVS